MDTENGGVKIGSYRTKDGTEFICGEDVKNRVVTYCPLRARKLSDVTLLVSEPEENVYDLFFDRVLAMPMHTKRVENGRVRIGEPAVFHTWNLDWEWKPLIQSYLERCDRLGLEPFTPSVVTTNGFYRLTLVFPDVLLIFVDDNNHYHNKVKVATEELMKKAKWREIFETADDGKALMGKESALVEGLHEIWYSYPEGSVERETYLHYAKVDAFCQALLMEELFETGRFCTPRCFDGEYFKMTGCTDTALSASGAGFRDAKSRLVYGCRFMDIPVAMKKTIEKYATKKGLQKKHPSDWYDVATEAIMGRVLDKKWENKFGLLKEKQQRVVENNLRGGFVYGKTGRFIGTFYHLDYKSSYPYEYAYCKLPIGRGAPEAVERPVTDKDGNPMMDENGRIKTKVHYVKRCVTVTKNADMMETWLERYDDDKHQIWVKGGVEFKLKEKALPLITAKECVNENGLAIKNYGGDRAKKMRSGKTRSILWTLEEWKLLSRLYDITDAWIDEMWISEAETGYFREAVEAYFDGKESSTGVERAMHKLDLNGATHGRPMIRVLTAPVIEVRDGKLFNCSVKEQRWQGEDDIKTNPIIGMTAMAHARVRLLNHCMDLIDAGYDVYMCDTDSLITDCPPDECARIWEAKGWKKWVLHEGYKGGMKDTLGRMEVEVFKDPLKVCPQLKGAEEIDELRCWGLKRYCELLKGCYRKSAFAGMHDEDQVSLLSGEYKKEFHWVSSGKQWLGECYGIRYHSVDVREESIWWDEA